MSFFTWHLLPKTRGRIVMLRYSTFNHLPHYLHVPHHLYLPLTCHSPWGETSDTATVAVSTHGVPLLIWKNNHNFFHKYQNVTFCYSYGGHRGCRATSQRAFKFLVTNVRYKMTPCFFTTKRWNRFFAIYVVRLALYVCLKNICDGIGGQDESNGIPLYPLFFGWTISLICPV